MSDWQPIETAPRDGGPFQAWIAYKNGDASWENWEPFVKIDFSTGKVTINDHTVYTNQEGEQWQARALFWMPHPSSPYDLIPIYDHPDATDEFVKPAEKGIPGLATREVEDE